MADALYRQIAEDLTRKIEAGELGRDGEPLPTEIELRDRYDASRNPVRDAIKLLTTRGVVEPRAGKGTFVVEKIIPYTIPLSLETGVGGDETKDFAAEVVARLRRPMVSDPVVEIQQANEFVGAELRLNVGENVVSRHQRRFIDDTPWALQTSFYPLRYVQQGATHLLLARDMPNGLAYLKDKLGVEVTGWRDRITVRAPDSAESAFFRLPDDGRISVFELLRTSYQADGTPIHLTMTSYPTDRNQFVVFSGTILDETIALPDGSILPNPAVGMLGQ